MPVTKSQFRPLSLIRRLLISDVWHQYPGVPSWHPVHHIYAICILIIGCFVLCTHQIHSYFRCVTSAPRRIKQTSSSPDPRMLPASSPDTASKFFPHLETYSFKSWKFMSVSVDIVQISSTSYKFASLLIFHKPWSANEAVMSPPGICCECHSLM